MSYNEEEIRTASQHIIEPLNELITWRWEDDKNVLLAEFASGKAERVIEVLRENFTHEWNKDTIKHLPNSIKAELADKAELTKTQTLYTISPQSEKPAAVAILWPWGHGSTLSLRLTLLTTPYEYIQPTQSNNIFVRFFEKAKKMVA
jgi:hypothetical protein